MNIARPTLVEALTFDDVLLKPAHSCVMPGTVDVRTRLTRSIDLNVPLISSAMDTVTEARLAIAMAQAGGIGVIHRNLEPEAQAEEVRKVKRFESGMVIDPITINPDATLAQALELMKRHNISGIPVVESGPAGLPARIVGILTNRDVRFADDPSQPVTDFMTKKVVTVREGVRPDEARRLLHQHRIEKLVVVDDDYRCVGLLTVKDMEKATMHPLACKDPEGRLRVAAASSVGAKGFARSVLLMEAGVDCIVVDTAHGHSQLVLDQVSELKRQSNKVALIAGNVATSDGAKALIDAGADVVKVEPPAPGPDRYEPGFRTWNRSKRSVALDLSTDDGKAKLEQLLAAADPQHRHVARQRAAQHRQLRLRARPLQAGGRVHLIVAVQRRVDVERPPGHHQRVQRVEIRLRQPRMMRQRHRQTARVRYGVGIVGAHRVPGILRPAPRGLGVQGQADRRALGGHGPGV